MPVRPALLIPALLLLPALALAAPAPTVGLWSDPALARHGSTPTDALAALIEGCGCQVEPLTTADLSNAARLDPTRLQCLVIPYHVFPAAASGALGKFVQGGGGLVLTEGDVFGRLLFPAGAGYALLDDFDAVAGNVQGRVDWDLGHHDGSEALSVAGTGTTAQPFVFRTRPENAFQYAGFKPPTLTPQAAGLVFEARGDRDTSLLCLEGQEGDGSRWKQIVSLTPEWREVRIHLASFCSYATPARGQAGDFLHPERLQRLYFGLFKGLVPPGEHRFEIRNLRFAQANVSSEAALAAGVPLPGRTLVEQLLGEAIAPVPTATWPQPFTGGPLLALTKLRPVGSHPLTEGLSFPSGALTAHEISNAPTWDSTGLFPGAKRTRRFLPLLQGTGPDGRARVVGALTLARAAGGRTSVQIALGLTGLDVAKPPLAPLLQRALRLMQSGAVLTDANPVASAAEGGQVSATPPVLPRAPGAGLQVRMSVDGAALPRVLPVAEAGAVGAALPLGDWRNFRLSAELMQGDEALDRTAWRVNVRQTLRDLCDFFVTSGADDGKFSGIYFIDSRAVWTLLAGYEIFADRRYLDTALHWTRVMIAEQRPDGGYRMGYGITRRGEECYVADGGEIALGLAQVAPYAGPTDRAGIMRSLDAYMAYRESFRVPTGGIGVGWCLTNYGQQPRVPLQEPTRVLAPEQNTYTIGCTLGAALLHAVLTGKPEDMQAAIVDGAWLMPRVPTLSGTTAQSNMLAHYLAPDDTVRAQYAANLRERFVDKLAGQENPWWIGSGGRSALNLHVLAYCYERLGRDPRVLTQMAKAVSAMCAPESPLSMYRLIGRTDLRHDEWLYLCFGGVGLADVVAPMVTLRKLPPPG
ncbi:hypothetical protein LLH23_21300 [bacterium]|nr:hypothetical protein [bacterium]